MDESDDVITGTSPVATDGEELRIRQIVAAGITPTVEIDVSIVAGSEETGYVIIVVPRSARAPHAVVKNADLRYPVRDGSGKRWMGEPEVADRYRARFVGASNRMDQLSAVTGRVRRRLDPNNNMVWLVVGGVPEIGGHLPISMDGKRDTQQWLRQVVAKAPPFAQQQHLADRISTGFRSYISGDFAADNVYSSRVVCELHGDGAAADALAVGWPQRNQDGESKLIEPSMVWDCGLAVGAIAALYLLGQHAERSGAFGDQFVVAELHSERELMLGHTRFHGIPEALSDTVSPVDLERASHTFGLDDLHDPHRLVATASLIAGDLLSALGYAECLQFSNDGEVRRRYLDHSYQRLEDWATREGVPVTDAVV